jgi:hypothetical protein
MFRNIAKPFSPNRLQIVWYLFVHIVKSQFLGNTPAHFPFSVPAIIVWDWKFLNFLNLNNLAFSYLPPASIMCTKYKTAFRFEVRCDFKSTILFGKGLVSQVITLGFLLPVPVFLFYEHSLRTILDMIKCLLLLFYFMQRVNLGVCLHVMK